MNRLPARAMIVGAGAITSVGYSVPQVWASVRAGIARFGNHPVLDTRFSETRLALVEEEDLEPWHADLDLAGLSNRTRRMIRLAAPALREATEGIPVSAPFVAFLGLPRPEARSIAAAGPAMVNALAKQSGVVLDEKASQVFPVGRAAFFLALDQALRFLATGRASHVLVGSVDSHLDTRLLANLEAEQRLLGDFVSDGLVPGEGAGMLVLGRPTSSQKTPQAFIAGVGVGKDPGHRYSQEPARGEGLWNAMNALFATSPLGNVRIGSTFAGLNGENFAAKEWGIAQLRHRACFADTGTFDHPADCYGDLGASTGAVTTALASLALTKHHRAGPALVWASSDHEERGCALVDVAV